MEVRRERPGDEDGIRALVGDAFTTLSEAKLVDALRDADHLTASWVALVAGELVGHLAFSPVRLEGTEGGLGLAPVAVREDHRRRGVAAELIRVGLAACEAESVPFVVVLGDPAYYRRFGFQAAYDQGLRDEYGGGTAFQVLSLRGTLPEGIVRYAPEFGSVD